MSLKQIGYSLQIYASENGGRFPPSFDELMTAGDLTPEIFVCASSNDNRASGPTTQAMIQSFHAPGFCSYVYTLPGGAVASSISAKHILAYESLANHPKKEGARDKGINVLYGDASVGWLTEKEAIRVSGELQAGFNPPRPAQGVR